MKPNTILIVIASIIVMAGAYWYFSTSTGNEPPLSEIAPASEAQSHFESVVQQLPISFDTSIFSDARFNSLVDISVPVSPEPAGRLDPLAPIPGVTGSK